MSVAQANVATRTEAAGATSTGTTYSSTATSVSNVLSATPQIPTVEASTTERTMFATPAPTSTRAISCCRRAGDQELRDEIDRLMDEEDEREQRQDRRALAVARRPTQPSISWSGISRSGNASSDRGRRPAAQAGEEQTALAGALARTLVLGEGGVEQAGADVAQAEREREELRRDRVERRRLGTEHDPDDDDVGREHDLAREVDEEVAPADRGQLAEAGARDESAAEAQVRQLAAKPRERQPEPQKRHPERQRPEQDQPAAAGQEDGHDRGVENRPHEVGEVQDVEALLCDEQVVEEAEREARCDREDEEQRRDARGPDEVVRRGDQLGNEPGEPDTERKGGEADQRVEHQAVRGDVVRVLGRPPAARFRREADDRGADAEIEHGQVDRDRADERPDAERLVSERVERDRGDEEPGDDRRRVDGVGPEDVSPEEPHQAPTVATTWKFAVSEPGRGSRRSATRRSRASAARLNSQTGPPASRGTTCAAERDLGVHPEQHRETRRGPRAGANLDATASSRSP